MLYCSVLNEVADDVANKGYYLAFVEFILSKTKDRTLQRSIQ